MIQLCCRNLDAFQNGGDTALNHYLTLDASKIVHLDGNAIPYGDFIETSGTIFDFKNGKMIGENFNQTVDNCGTGLSTFFPSFRLGKLIHTLFRLPRV